MAALSAGIVKHGFFLLQYYVLSIYQVDYGVIFNVQIKTTTFLNRWLIGPGEMMSGEPGAKLPSMACGNSRISTIAFNCLWSRSLHPGPKMAKSNCSGQRADQCSSVGRIISTALQGPTSVHDCPVRWLSLSTYISWPSDWPDSEP